MRSILLLLSLFAVRASAAIISFTANPTSFLPGQDVTLSWSVTAGDVISIDQGVPPISGATGSVTVQPTVTTTYTLTNSTSGTTAQVTVTSYSPPVIVNRWSFDEGSGAAVNDSVGAQHGAIRGTTFTRTATAVSLPGGVPSTSAYIDLPNNLITTLNETTFEGWMTLNGSQNWSRIFDFGTNTAGEILAPGGSHTGVETFILSAQVGGTTNLRRLSLRDNNVEQLVDLTDPVSYGTQFHFAVVYDVDGNAGQPQVRYYKNGTLVGALNTTYRLQNITNVNNWLGRSNWSGDNNTNGAYNEFRIWNGALSASVLADNVAAGPDALPSAPRIEAFNSFPDTTLFRGSSVRLSYVLTDPTGTGLTASIDNGVGALSGNSGFLTVSPTADTTYTLTVTNASGTRTAALNVVVLPSEPTVQDLAVNVGYQTATPITLVASDPNTPLNQLTFTIVTPPANGALTGSGAARTYTPAPGFSGPDSFTYKANDGLADSNVATVSLNVRPAPAPPTSITLSQNVFRTNYTVGSLASRLQAVDVNPDDQFTFQLVGGAGATHNGFFSIVGNQLIAQHDFAADLGQTISIRVRVTDSANNSIEMILTRTVAAADLHVKINEVNYNPARNTQRSEFIELYNPFNVPADISGWRLEGVSYSFPPGTTIPALGYLVVAEDPATIQALYGLAALGPWIGGLSSDGEEIILENANGDDIDKLEYGITAPWPVPPNGDGPTLELVNPTLDNDLGGHWHASTAAPPAMTFVAAGSGGWRYRKGTSEASAPVNAWRAENFVEDATWITGTMPIGLYKQNSNGSLSFFAETGVTLATRLDGNAPDTAPAMATFVASSSNSYTNFTVAYRSVYFRKTFNVTNQIPRAVLLRVMHNDAAIVWINDVEVARFGFPPGAVGEIPFNHELLYERGNDPWSDAVLLGANTLLHEGTNTIAIHGFSKRPRTRADQEDLGAYNIFDFSIDAELKTPTELIGTPGAQNSVFAANPAPAIRDVDHLPLAPLSSQPVKVTARVSDPQGVGNVQLAYQICAPGNFIPATLPLTNAQILANPDQPLPPNPAFEAPANWTMIPMIDTGGSGGDVAGDGIFTATIPAQSHRTLVRYRIIASDLPGASHRIPATDDPRKNYAFFVYNGVPNYAANGQVFSSTTLTTLPVYHWITRAADYSRLLAYTAGDQFANNIALNVLRARRYENFEGALVVGDQVVDHAVARLRGGNSRYAGAGKRHFRFKFPKGSPLDAADERGNEYPRPWEEMLFNKMFGNKGYYDFGIPYEVGTKLWTQQGVPMPFSHWVHFRVIQNAAEAATATTGDFWGLYQALELPEGKNFLDSRDLPPGNFYKMSDWEQNGEMAERYQAKGAVDYAEDYDNIRFNIHQTASDATLRQYVNMPLWYRYDAVKEAIRHYDIFVEPTGRHRVKNLIWYFKPETGTNGLGNLWFMPYDWDASWGPNFNSGWEMVHNAVFDHYDITDSPTWLPPKVNRLTTMRIEYRNAIRDFRDLVWHRDGTRGPVDDMIDDALATITPFWQADRARWPQTGAVADYAGGAPVKVQDMKNFAFTGWTDTLADGSPAVGAGGRAAHLDIISDNFDTGQLPAKPTIAYTGAAGFPVDGITLQSSAFSDPQGAPTFGAMQWRVGEITDPTAPAYDPLAERIYEAAPVWESGEITTFNANTAVPGTVLRAGHTYRARVRHRDTSGRWGHWSAPLQFTAATSNYQQVLKDNLMISEIMYNPAPPSPAESAYLEGDFEYIELRNISSSFTLDLSNVRFTKGLDFDFAGSAITSLAPGASVLVVKNVAAFTLRHGAGKPVAGAWELSDNLSNSGEELKLSYGAGAAIHNFVYDDNAPWPTRSDEGGWSLVLKNPESRPNHGIATNWRASYGFGGTPGSDDRTNYDAWSAERGLVDPSSDDEGDGLTGLMEYALGGEPDTSDRGLLPQAGIITLDVGSGPERFLTLTYRRALGAEDLTYVTEWSGDLNTWTANGVLVTASDQLDGTIIETWRAPLSVSAGLGFGRLRVTRP